MAQDGLQKRGGIRTLYDESARHVIIGFGFAFPEQVRILLAVRMVDERAVRHGGNAPAGFPVCGVGRGQRAAVIERNGNVHGFFRVKINNGLCVKVRCGRIVRAAAPQEKHGCCCGKQKNAASQKPFFLSHWVLLSKSCKDFQLDSTLPYVARQMNVF